MNDNVTHDIDKTICSIGLFIRRELEKDNITVYPYDMVKALADLVRARASLTYLASFSNEWIVS